jgi:hypothetical protein
VPGPAHSPSLLYQLLSAYLSIEVAV